MHRLELPISGVPYVLTGQVDDDSGNVLVDIAVRLDDQSGPVTVGSLAAPPNHLSGLAKALPQLLRSLAQAHRSRPARPARGTYQDRLAATRARYPRAYLPWDQDEEQRLRDAFDPDSSNLTRHLEELADSFLRQPSAIRSRLVRLGLLTG